MKASLNENAWDGDWYRRAYFDDGTALGSVSNSECRIDSIAQSWSVISGAGEPQHAARAMQAVDKYLAKRDEALLLLFTPPFDTTPLDPGYIKGYPPGIRENGGQYTHAALWAAQAFAMLKNGEKAMEYLSIANPILHGDSPSAVQRYKVEPYAVCADVYSVHPHVGRGGWSWYTGSAGVMYRVIVERIVGLRVQGTRLRIDPCIPKQWPGLHVTFRHRSATYDIAIENPLGTGSGVFHARIDGETLADPSQGMALADDGKTHRIEIVLG